MIRHLRVFVILLLMSSAALAQDAEQPREGGLTGTGIVGLLNGDGAIEVGGLSVVLPATLSVQTPLGLAAFEQMQTGDMIAFQFEGPLQDLTVVDAQQVIQMIGPITAQAGDTLNVMGNAVFGAAPAGTARVGDWVTISGYWREDGVVATRIGVVAPQIRFKSKEPIMRFQVILAVLDRH